MVCQDRHKAERGSGEHTQKQLKARPKQGSQIRITVFPCHSVGNRKQLQPWVENLISMFHQNWLKWILVLGIWQAHSEGKTVLGPDNALCCWQHCSASVDRYSMGQILWKVTSRASLQSHESQGWTERTDCCCTCYATLYALYMNIHAMYAVL